MAEATILKLVLHRDLLVDEGDRVVTEGLASTGQGAVGSENEVREVLRIIIDAPVGVLVIGPIGRRVGTLQAHSAEQISVL